MLSVALKSGWPFEHFPQLDILEGGCPLIARSNRFLTGLSRASFQNTTTMHETYRSVGIVSMSVSDGYAAYACW